MHYLVAGAVLYHLQCAAEYPQDGLGRHEAHITVAKFIEEFGPLSHTTYINIMYDHYRIIMDEALNVTKWIEIKEHTGYLHQIAQIPKAC